MSEFQLLVHLCILTFLGQSQVSGQYPLPGKCPNIPPFRYLDLNRYAGEWYEVERFFFLPQVTGRCISVRYQPTQAGTLDTTIRLKESISGTKTVYTGITRFLDPPTADNFRIGNMQLTLDLMVPLLPQPQIQYTYSYKVADTDYENYIIKFGCYSLSQVHFESVWILARDPTYPPHVKYMIRQSLERLGINKDLLIQSTC